jgi:hypothetical protein
LQEIDGEFHCNFSAFMLSYQQIDVINLFNSSKYSFHLITDTELKTRSKRCLANCFCRKNYRKIVYFTFGTFCDRSRRSADSVQVGVFHLGQTQSERW